MPQKPTVQIDVAPGDVTGMYYIPICSFPWGTQWQDLKDWVQMACRVERVEVFPESTSGWVLVKGKENFDKIWTYLQTTPFNERMLIASDRNVSEWIKVRVPADEVGHA